MHRKFQLNPVYRFVELYVPGTTLVPGTVNALRVSQSKTDVDGTHHHSCGSRIEIPWAQWVQVMIVQQGYLVPVGDGQYFIYNIFWG